MKEIIAGAQKWEGEKRFAERTVKRMLLKFIVPKVYIQHNHVKNNKCRVDIPQLEQLYNICNSSIIQYS